MRQQTTPLAHHEQKAPPRSVILGGILKMIRQAVDALGEERDLHSRVPGVPGGRAKLPNDIVCLRSLVNMGEMIQKPSKKVKKISRKFPLTVTRTGVNLRCMGEYL
jgi:hypothetical protein